MRRFAPLIDLLVVLVFAAVGRSSHQHGVSVTGVVSTTWPFAAGLAAGWVFLVRRHRTGLGMRDGVIVCLWTVAVGMVLRIFFGQGTAVAFILVAIGFLGALMFAWRATVWFVQRQRAE